MISICLERGWVFHGPTRSIPRHVTGYLITDVYLRVSTLAANAGDGQYPVIKLHTKKTVTKEGKVTTVYSYFEIQINLP